MFKTIFKAILHALAWLLPFINQWIMPSIDIIEVIKESLTDSTQIERLLLKFFNGDEAKVEATLLKIIKVIESLQIFTSADLSNLSTLEIISKFMTWLLGLSPALREPIFAKLAAGLVRESGSPAADIKDNQLNAMIEVALAHKKDQASV
jgi:hypothetical protein